MPSIEVEMKVDGLDIQMYRKDEYDEEYNEFNDGADVHEYQINDDVDVNTGEDLPEGNRSSGFLDLNLEGTYAVTSDFIKQILRRKRNIIFAPGQESYIPEDTRSLYCNGGDSLENVMKEHMKKTLLNWLNPKNIEFRHLMEILFETNTVINCDGRSYPIVKTDPSSCARGLTLMVCPSDEMNGKSSSIITIINEKWYFKEFLKENAAISVWAYDETYESWEDPPEVPGICHWTYETESKRLHNKEREPRLVGSIDQMRQLLDKRELRRICGGYPSEDGFDYRRYNQLLKDTITENNLPLHKFLDGEGKPFIYEF